jgi:hypothetical protein
MAKDILLFPGKGLNRARGVVLVSEQPAGIRTWGTNQQFQYSRFKLSFPSSELAFVLFLAPNEGNMGRRSELVGSDRKTG